MQHVMLTSAPYSCFIRQYPAERDSRGRTGREGERGGDDMWVLLGFLCLDVKPREALTEMWQIPAMSKTGGLAPILICQVRQCFGSVGGVVRLCVLVFLSVQVWLKVCVCVCVCIMHVRRHSAVSVPLCRRSAPSCQFGLSFKHQ